LCPGCDQPADIRTVRQRRTLEAGGTVYHNRDCQRAAGTETRPCSAPGCGKTVTRRKSGFSGETVACSPACRGALKKTRQVYTCSLPGCGLKFERTPAEVTPGAPVYCSREHNAEGKRLASVMVPCGYDGVLFLCDARRANRGSTWPPPAWS
jgi:hypothetical protein